MVARARRRARPLSISAIDGLVERCAGKALGVGAAALGNIGLAVVDEAASTLQSAAWWAAVAWLGTGVILIVVSKGSRDRDSDRCPDKPPVLSLSGKVVLHGRVREPNGLVFLVLLMCRAILLVAGFACLVQSMLGVG